MSNKKLHFNAKNVYLTLFDNFIRTQEDCDKFLNRLCMYNNKNIQGYVIGNVEKGEMGQLHQHVFVKGNHPLEFNSKPYIKLADGTETRIHYVPASDYTNRTGDITRIIDYIISVLERKNTEITIKAIPSYLVERATVAKRGDK